MFATDTGIIVWRLWPPQAFGRREPSRAILERKLRVAIGALLRQRECGAGRQDQRHRHRNPKSPLDYQHGADTHRPSSLKASQMTGRSIRNSRRRCSSLSRAFSSGLNGARFSPRMLPFKLLLQLFDFVFERDLVRASRERTENGAGRKDQHCPIATRRRTRMRTARIFSDDSTARRTPASRARGTPGAERA